MKSVEIVIETRSPEESRSLGARLGALLRSGDVVLLNGDLGAGKTTLTQGIASGLGVQDYVQSPTFTIVQEHDGRLGSGEQITLYHLDLYRLTDESDLESIGFDQYLEPMDGVSVIEWPERAAGWLPDRYVLVDLTIGGPDSRLLEIVVIGDQEFQKRFAGLS